MLDQYGREINYMRISLTDRCNLRCSYCMPEEGVDVIPAEELLTFEEIKRIVRVSVPLGLRHIKITGGEPLVRKDAPQLIADLKQIPGIETVTLTTNGILLMSYMRELAQAGLDGVNISLDTLREDEYHALTRCGHVQDVLEGLQEALRYPEVPVKINCVLEERGWRHNAVEVASLAGKYPVHVRFIERMPLADSGICVSSQEEMVRELLENTYGTMTPFRRTLGYGPGVYYSLPGFQGKIGFISALSHKFCGQCNRVRLTSSGFLRMCLQSENGINLKTPMRRGCPDAQLKKLLTAGIRNKPQEHHFKEQKISTRSMSEIGG